MTEDRSPEKEDEFPNKEGKDVEKLVNEGLKQLSSIGWQCGRREMIEINGFPQKEEEDTKQLVTDLADEMGISIRLYDIKANHRLSQREKADVPIIVMFKSRKLRNKFYEPRKHRVGFESSICVVCIACVSVKIIEPL